MADIIVTENEIEPGEVQNLQLAFKFDDSELKVKISFEFEGDWNTEDGEDSNFVAGIAQLLQQAFTE